MLSRGGSQSDYSAFAKLLHWLIAALVGALVVLGLVMTGIKGDLQLKLSLYQLHKSIGLTVLSLVALRVFWRHISPPPPLPEAMPAWERRAARSAHILLYVLLFAVPLSGWVRVSASPLPVPTVVFGVFTLPHLPFLASLDPQQKRELEPLLRTIHWGLAWSLVALVAVHAAAALRHALFLKDGIMTRMLPRWRRLGSALLVAGLCAGGMALLMPAGNGAYAAEWRIEPQSSRIGFTGKAGGQEIRGVFEEFSGVVVFDPAALERTKVEVTVQTASARTGNADIDSTLPTADWFAASEYPAATFSASAAEAIDASGERYAVKGELTLKGHTAALTIPFTLKIEGETAQAHGKATLNRLDFGIGPQTPIVGIPVAEEVAIDFSLTAVKTQ